MLRRLDLNFVAANRSCLPLLSACRSSCSWLIAARYTLLSSSSFHASLAIVKRVRSTLACLRRRSVLSCLAGTRLDASKSYERYGVGSQRSNAQLTRHGPALPLSFAATLDLWKHFLSTVKQTSYCVRMT